MTSPHPAVTRYWAAETGCAAAELFREPLSVVPHGPLLADYDGIFALFREGAARVSLPRDRFEALQARLPDPPFTPDELAGCFTQAGFRVIGPAFIGYARECTPCPGAVRVLEEPDLPLAREFQAACSEEEWDHGGSEVGASPASGAFAGEALAALAGYEIWDGGIAHISVVTHPGYRGRGYGRQAVAHLAARALAAGLVPQYRTLEANTPSMRIAEALGFQCYACSVAVRLEGGA